MAVDRKLAERRLRPHLSRAKSTSSRALAWLWRLLADVVAFTFSTLRGYLRIDVPLAIFAVVFIALFAPLIPRNTDNPQLVAAYSNDEPFLTMALEATLVPPFGNPGAYFDPYNAASSDVPEHWAEMRYPNIVYYGGAMFDLAFPPYALLRAAGLPPFPTGPILLRSLTLLAGLLSLIVLYNIAKERGSRVAGLFAAAWVASDGYFLYYANFIHPDTLQMLFGLAAFLVAVAHARDGGRTSLVALGLFCGIVQGTKSGGVWTLPMALLAIWIGAVAGGFAPLARLRRSLVRVPVFAAAALIGFFVTTPYAFLDGYYLRSLRLAYGAVTRNALQLKEISLLTWAEALYDYIGLVGTVLVALTVARAIWINRRGMQDVAIVLAPVLAASQFLYYGGAGRLWHVPGYLLLGYGLMATFVFETVLDLPRRVVRAASAVWPRALRVERVAWATVALVVGVILASGRWYVPAAWAVDQHTVGRSTVRAANDWAVDHRIDPDAVIVFDDLAYFDRQRFPHARLHGGVLTWRAVESTRPDYIVLSQSLYGAAWMQDLIATQKLARGDPEPFNVRLYQDLLATKVPGPTKVPGIELEGILQSAAGTGRPVIESRLAEVAGSCSLHALCDLRIVDLYTELALAADIERRVRALTGTVRGPLVGPELRIFRVHEPAATRSLLG